MLTSCFCNPLPIAEQIRLEFSTEYEVTTLTFVDGENAYLKLIHHTYILLYMLHHKMPLQRHFMPGKGDTAKRRMVWIVDN